MVKNKQISFYLLILLVVSIFYGLCLGSVSMPLSHIVVYLLSPWQADTESIQYAVFWSLRVPHVFAVALVGAALGYAGAVMQGFLKNPLADPALLGVSSGAGFMVVLMLFLMQTIGVTLGSMSCYVMPVSAILGAFLVLGLVYQFSKWGRAQSITLLLLAGVALNTFFIALTTLILSLSSLQTLRSAVYWSFGGVEGVTMPMLMVLLPFVIFGAWLLWRQHQTLNVMMLGEASAFHLGVSLGRFKRQILIGVALMVGCCVAIAGPIGFVGLMVPHMVRFLVGGNHRILLPMSAMAGAVLLVLADNLSRGLFAPIVIPLGVITAVFGVPFFLWLLLKRAKGAFYA